MNRKKKHKAPSHLQIMTSFHINQLLGFGKTAYVSPEHLDNVLLVAEEELGMVVSQKPVNYPTRYGKKLGYVLRRWH